MAANIYSEASASPSSFPACGGLNAAIWTPSPSPSAFLSMLVPALILLNQTIAPPARTVRNRVPPAAPNNPMQLKIW